MAAQAINLGARRRPALSHKSAPGGGGGVHLRRTLNQTTVTANNVCQRLRMGHKTQINDGHSGGDCDYDNENNKGDYHDDDGDGDDAEMMN